MSLFTARFPTRRPKLGAFSAAAGLPRPLGTLVATRGANVIGSGGDDVEGAFTAPNSPQRETTIEGGEAAIMDDRKGQQIAVGDLSRR